MSGRRTASCLLALAFGASACNQPPAEKPERKAKSAPTRDFRAELHSAAAAGDVAAIEALPPDVDVNMPLPDDERALVLAAANGHTGAARALLDRGADVKATGPSRASALEFALRRGKVAVAALLVERGADLAAFGGAKELLALVGPSGDPAAIAFVEAKAGPVDDSTIVEALLAGLRTDDAEAVAAAFSTRVAKLAPPARKTLSDGLLALLAHDLGHVRRGAAAVLVSTVEPDKAARTQVLARLAVERDPGVSEKLLVISKKLGPETIPGAIALLRDPSATARSLAMRVLEGFGPEASAAVPALTKLVDDPSYSLLAVHTLGSLGAAAVPPLAARLGENEPTLRSAIVAALGKIGAPAMPALTKALAAPRTRETAGRALLAAGAAAAPAARAVVPLLADSFELATIAREILASCGAAAAPELARCVRSTSTGEICAELLADIGPAAKSIVPELVPALATSNIELRFAVIRAMQAIEPDHPEAIAALDSSLTDSNAETRARAADLAGALGASAKGSLRTLIGALKDTSRHVRAGAAMAIGKIAAIEESKDAVPLLLGILSVKVALETVSTQMVEVLEEDRLSAAWALGRLRVAAALPAIGELLASGAPRPGAKTPPAPAPQAAPEEQQDDPAAKEDELRARRRIAALEALAELGPPARSLLPEALAIVGGLPAQDGSWPPLIRLLTELKADGSAALPHMRKLFEDGTAPPEVRFGAAAAIVAIDGGGPATAQILRRPDPDLGAVALTAIASMDAVPASLAPELTSWAERPQPQARTSALRAIAKIGPAAGADIAKLLELAYSATEPGEIGELADTLRAIDPDSKKLTKVIEGRPTDVQRVTSTITLLEKIGTPAAQATAGDMRKRWML